MDSCNPALIGEKQEDRTFEARGYLMRAEEGTDEVEKGRGEGREEG